MKFLVINNQRINILDDKNKIIGKIFAPSGSGGSCRNAIQICGFSEAFDLRGCAAFEGFKDIQLLFDNNPTKGKPAYDIENNCMKCYREPCQCEKYNNNMPFSVKHSRSIKDRMEFELPKVDTDKVDYKGI